MTTQLARLLLMLILGVSWVVPSLAASPKKCGTERWDVKTLSDSDAGHVEAKVVHTTVAHLNTLPSRCSNTPKERDADIESTVYEVVGRIVFASHEDDRDVHLAIQDLKQPKRTMIVEIADPTCPVPVTPRTRHASKRFVPHRFRRACFGAGELP